MIRIAAICFLMIHFLVVLKPYSPYLDYVLNFEYISNVLCENKDKPELNCHGSCHLTKELKKTLEDETVPVNNTKRTTGEFSHYIGCHSAWLETGSWKRIMMQHAFFRPGYYIQYSGEPLVPPPQA